MSQRDFAISLLRDSATPQRDFAISLESRRDFVIPIPISRFCRNLEAISRFCDSVIPNAISRIRLYLIAISQLDFVYISSYISHHDPRRDFAILRFLRNFKTASRFRDSVIRDAI